MNWSVKLAKSLIKDKTLQRHHFIQTICQVAIALCITTVLISSFLIRGFESKIEEKIFDFWSHIRISSLSNSSNQILDNPLKIDLNTIKAVGIDKIVPVCNRGVILKYKSNIEGIVLKGVPLSQKGIYHFTSKENLPCNAESEIPIILSDNTLAKLNAQKNDIIYVNIIDSIPKTIKARVINSYYTNIEEFDAQIAITDIGVIQSINRWSNDEYSWVEASVKDINHIEETSRMLYTKLTDVNVDTIYSIYPQLFDWLALMKRNEIIILIVMLIVAMVNIISTISIFIIEKTKLIGMLKVLGAKNDALIAMLFYQVMRIILIGLIAGNILTLIITAIMYYLKPIHLDPKIYYIDYAPIQFDFLAFILINLLSIIICMLSAAIPLLTIIKISPVKVVEYN